MVKAKVCSINHLYEEYVLALNLNVNRHNAVYLILEDLKGCSSIV